MPTGVRVEGLNGTIRNLQRLGVEVSDLKEVFAKIATEAARTAATLAPRRTGRLAGTIRGNKAKNKAIVTVGKARVPYAAAINYGWPARNIAPTMFLQRADRVMQPKVQGMLEDGLKDAISRSGLG